MSISLKSAQSIFANTLIADAVPAVTAAFDQLSVEDQLALLWYAYTEMGITITPAATGSASMVLAQPLLDQIKAMQPAEQTQVMTDLAMHTDTPICRTFTSYRMNTKLGFWYELGQMMKQGLVAPIPAGYVASPEATDLLDPTRLRAAVAECEAFHRFLTQTFESISARKELAATPFDRRAAADTLRMYLGEVRA